MNKWIIIFCENFDTSLLKICVRYIITCASTLKKLLPWLVAAVEHWSSSLVHLVLNNKVSGWQFKYLQHIHVVDVVFVNIVMSYWTRKCSDMSNVGMGETVLLPLLHNTVTPPNRIFWLEKFNCFGVILWAGIWVWYNCIVYCIRFGCDHKLI